MLTGENGLLTKASDAKVQTEKAGAKEKVQLEVAGSIGTDGKLSLDELNKNLEKNIPGIKHKGNPITSLPATVVVDGYDIEIKGTGEVVIVGENTDTGDDVNEGDNGDNENEEENEAVLTEYVKEGLVLLYDATNNTGQGHSNTTKIWKNLATEDFDGVLHGCTWGNNYLQTDGVDDWLGIGLMHFQNVTVETVLAHGSTTEAYGVNNFDAGGIRLI